MAQEIITYLIIGIAVLVVVLKAKKKFWKTNKKAKISNNTITGIQHQHNCSDCSAECILRDATTRNIQNNKELCKKIEISSGLD